MALLNSTPFQLSMRSVSPLPHTFGIETVATLSVIDTDSLTPILAGYETEKPADVENFTP